MTTMTMNRCLWSLVLGNLVLLVWVKMYPDSLVDFMKWMRFL